MTVLSEEVRWERAIYSTLAEMRERGPQIAVETESRIRKQYSDAYASVSTQGLQASCLRNVELSYWIVREHRHATPQELAAHATVAAERAREGVPVEDMLSAWSLTMGVIRDTFLELALEWNARPRSILEATQLLWALAEDITVQLAVVHHDTEVALARHDELQRTEFLRHVLLGSVSGGELNRRAATYGLQLSERYHAVRARPIHAGDAGSLTQLRRALETSVAWGGRQNCLVAILDGDVAGVVATPPNVKMPGAMIGVGPPAHLGAMEPSYAAASRILDVGLRFSMTGTHTLIDVAAQAAVADESEIGDLLVDRYLEPLSTVPDLRDAMEETLRIFFANGLSLKRTAQMLRIHPNTVRYRLRRFEEITDADLADTEVLFRVWWAVERARILTEPAEVR
ncbi:MAG TPA: helix-turn-helix domain-containing protein [Acidimicrobiia bacterium]|jgi:putative transposase